MNVLVTPNSSAETTEDAAPFAPVRPLSALPPRACLTIAWDWFRIYVEKIRHLLDVVRSYGTLTCELGMHIAPRPIEPHQRLSTRWLRGRSRDRMTPI